MESPLHEFGAAPLAATLHLAFAFDVGYEIDLDAARGLVAVEDGAPSRASARPSRSATAPRRCAWPSRPAACRLRGDSHYRRRRAELSVFDFGAASLMVHLPVRATPSELSRALAELAEPSAWVESAQDDETSTGT